MKNFEKNCLKPDSTLRNALETINSTSIQFILIVDDSMKLLGVVSDGDLRKAILRGETLESPLTEIMAKTPVTMTADNTRNEVLRKFQTLKIRHIPIVDPDGKVLDLFSLQDLMTKSTRGVKAVLMAGG